MGRITKDPVREIIEDFAEEIKKTKASGPKPQTAVIDFRNERADNFEREVVTVPVRLLRFRKDNGRIASDVYSYERNVKPLSEEDDEDQKILASFLKGKDPEQTDNLKNSIMLKGQEQPAIITCDGFLINGNRRKLVFEILFEKTHDSKFERMRVVILPGPNDPGGAPTIKEIDQIENRYQLQKDGKSEYSNFDRALTVRRKINEGMTLEEQLRDDPKYVPLSQPQFKKEVERFEEEYLKPLECIDDYLESMDRDGVYTLVSGGMGDREGRWQAFVDYYKSVRKKLDSEKERIKLGIDEDEVGKIEDTAFKLIRFREFPGTKVHTIMRNLPKLLSNQDAKSELLKISKIPDIDLTDEVTEDGEPKYDDLDRKWANKNKTEIIRLVQKAVDLTDRSVEMETPLDLLRQALKKLEHEKMDPDQINITDLNEAMKLAEKVEQKAKELKNMFYQHQKSKDKLITKYSRN